MTMASIEVDPRTLAPATNTLPLLKHVPYIYYLIQFQKDQVELQALINFGSEINTMTLLYMSRLGFKVRATNIRA